MGRLDELDFTARLSTEEYEQRLYTAQRRLLELRLEIGGHLDSPDLGPGVAVVLEGSDAGGKGGAIKRIVEPLDPRHYRVNAYAKPTFDEKRKHFLWRFWQDLPGLGGMALFDRSWYGRVLVERVEGYASKAQWKRAYDEIVQFERNLVLEGVIIVKFWLQITPDEQLRRFEKRQVDPLRKWKLTDEDWRNRDKIDRYNAAVEDMFRKTDHELAPWHVVSGEQKKRARVEVLETLVRRIEDGIEAFEHPVPDENGWA
ncbi:MAG: UDP-galactose-lipid carrier transferase [Ilumatobacter sp.]|uniref:polyphosphate kinase 2 family protein n=1 Tax=Ilumatobacter sp. TaxID=1967498 RepID=UPI00262D3031|nr:UDP-galactose-lipid carrier transferase [Ilumatobacter sp.]MDJ0769652.1 UDP-galactose-lipid carrier transferase [Ilumatobacter sp.]